MALSKESAMIDEYISITKDLLVNEQVQKMKTYRHHGDTNTHFHSVYVSYRVLKLCKKLHVANAAEIVRAALLHDFYLYEWYTEKHDENHIWYHPKESVKNIETYLGTLSDTQRNMILSHMFPLCSEMPKCRGAWLLTLADKRCATEDYLTHSRQFYEVYEEIIRRAEA